MLGQKGMKWAETLPALLPGLCRTSSAAGAPCRLSLLHPSAQLSPSVQGSSPALTCYFFPRGGSLGMQVNANALLGASQLTVGKGIASLAQAAQGPKSWGLLPFAGSECSASAWGSKTTRCCLSPQCFAAARGCTRTPAAQLSCTWRQQTGSEFNCWALSWLVASHGCCC